MSWTTQKIILTPSIEKIFSRLPCLSRRVPLLVIHHMVIELSLIALSTHFDGGICNAFLCHIFSSANSCVFWTKKKKFLCLYKTSAYPRDVATVVWHANVMCLHSDNCFRIFLLPLESWWECSHSFWRQCICIWNVIAGGLNFSTISFYFCQRCRQLMKLIPIGFFKNALSYENGMYSGNRLLHGKRKSYLTPAHQSLILRRFLTLQWENLMWATNKLWILQFGYP